MNKLANPQDLMEFDAAAVAQEFFDGSQPLVKGWQAGDYRIDSPKAVWVVEADEKYARKEERLTRFVGGVAYSLAANGDVAPETVTPDTVQEVCVELERLICTNLHVDGAVAGEAEHERVMASRSAYRARQERIAKSGEKVVLSIFDHGPIDYRKTSFA